MLEPLHSLLPGEASWGFSGRRERGIPPVCPHLGTMVLGSWPGARLRLQGRLRSEVQDRVSHVSWPTWVSRSGRTLVLIPLQLRFLAAAPRGPDRTLNCATDSTLCLCFLMEEMQPSKAPLKSSIRWLLVRGDRWDLEYFLAFFRYFINDL